ncbi:MAG: hypothetical protein ACXVBN_05945 [Flavisolibacter sp.]
MTLKIFKRPIFYFIISALLLLPNFIDFHFVHLAKVGHKWENYDPILSQRLRSVKDVLEYSDSIASVNHTPLDSLGYGIIINRVIKSRFYHGYSYYGLNENWIAAVAGRYIWSDLGAIVLPDDILKYPMAACSQQSIVLMECFKRKNISFRKVGFDHHFSMEGKFKNKWYYFDPDLEPSFTAFPRTGIDSIVKAKALYRLYKASLDSAQIRDNLANYYVGKPNVSAAPHASLFHEVTKYLSKTIFFLPFFCGIFLLKSNRKKKMNPYDVGAIYENHDLKNSLTDL